MGKYRTIVADPPWAYKDGPWGKNSLAPGRAFLPYGVMESAEIAALPVKEMAETDAHLYMWTTQRFVTDSFDIARAWGFKPVCLLVWCKPPMPALPGTWKSTVEFVLFARRGSLKALSTIEKQWFEWPRGKHSAKPDAFLDLVEQVSPAPRLEMFARRARFGWDYWGNESLGTASMEAAV